MPNVITKAQTFVDSGGSATFLVEAGSNGKKGVDARCYIKVQNVGDITWRARVNGSAVLSFQGIEIEAASDKALHSLVPAFQVISEFLATTSGRSDEDAGFGSRSVT